VVAGFWLWRDYRAAAAWEEQMAAREAIAIQPRSLEAFQEDMRQWEEFQRKQREEEKRLKQLIQGLDEGLKETLDDLDKKAMQTLEPATAE
jgi:hypothetical protein